MMLCSIPGCGRETEARGWCRRHYANWHRTGNPIPQLRNEHGKGSVTVYGYRLFTRNYVCTREHVEVAERALGKPLPPGAMVHHVDHQKANNAPTNLVICPSNAYHALIHKRERALDACGNASYENCWYCKRYDDPANLKHNRHGHHYHVACLAAYDAKKYAAKKASHA